MALPAGTFGTIESGFSRVGALLGEFVDKDPTYSGSLCIYKGAEPVVDVWWGPGLGPDSLLPIFSSSKGAAGFVIARLLQDGLLELDATVSSYWPEFEAADKARMTVRQLLSHQGGLPGVDGGYTYEELYDHDALAARLANQRPMWRPGKAHEYHGVTIGVLADELVRRTTGSALGSYLSDNVCGPRGLDVHLGTPEELDERVVDVQIPTAEELAAFPDAIPQMPPGSLAWSTVPRNGPPIWFECNSERFRRAGTPAAGGLASARGLAGLYASARHDIDGVPRLLNDDVMGRISQMQVEGYPLSDSNIRTAFAIIFQKPTDYRPWGSYQGFGHDGLGGALAFFDPFDDISLGYTVQRIPLPGGADARAIELSKVAHKCALKGFG
jgi:CubicO group peptidase (beta-lactamase class C family)